MPEVGNVGPGTKTQEAQELSAEMERIKNLLQPNMYPDKAALDMALIKVAKSSLYPVDFDNPPKDEALVVRVISQYDQYIANPNLLKLDRASIAR